MTLTEGIGWMWSGKGLRRPHWAKETRLCAYMSSNSPFVFVKGKDMVVRKTDFKPTIEDLLATDWETCEA